MNSNLENKVRFRHSPRLYFSEQENGDLEILSFGTDTAVTIPKSDIYDLVSVMTRFYSNEPT